MRNRISVLLCILVFTAMPVHAIVPLQEIGEEVDSSTYINRGDIQAFSDIDSTSVFGVYNPDSGDGFFSGSITNEGSISAVFAANYANVHGIYSFDRTDIIDSTIANSGDILAEWSLQDTGGDARGGALGLTASHVEQSAITNSGNITSRARLNNIGGEALVFIRGIQVRSAIGTLQDSSIFNSGSIETKVNIDGTDGLARGRSEGIYVDSVKNSSIENPGTITSSVTLQDIGGYASFVARGIEIDYLGSRSSRTKELESSTSDSEVNKVSNAGNIDSTINIDGTQGDASGWADGIFADHAENSSIENTGSINSNVILNNIDGISNSMEGFSADARARGIFIGGHKTLKESSILNFGRIDTIASIAGTQGDAQGRASGIFSVTAENSGIENAGGISSSVNLKDISGYADAEASGIAIDRMGASLEFFSTENSTSESESAANWISNSGNIDTTASIDGTQGDASGSAIGISVFHAENSNIENTGSINSNVVLNNIGGSATVQASGIHIGRHLMAAPETLIDSSIVNTGTIKTNADLANIKGDAITYATGISVDLVRSNSKPTTIENHGTIDVSVTTDNSANRTDFLAGGIIVTGSDENKIQVKNSGMIKLDVSDLGDFEETVNPEGGQIASAVLFASTAADFSNTGRLYTSGNARALSLYEGSDVTLQNGFGYAFAGNPAEVKRPVFVDGTSTLDLNNVPLIADGASDTVLGRPYYVVDENSTVENTWGALENGFANQDITVNWYGNDRAENSAVIFNLAPRGNKSARAGMAARTAAYASQRQLSQYLLSGHVFGGEGFLADAQKNNEPILLASAGISDVLSLGASGTTYKNGAYILPYYTGTHDSGLGADITSKGLFLGYERNLDAVTAGVFGGYGNNAVRLTDTYKGNHEDQDGYTAGVYGIYNQKKWFGALYASYNEIEHNYSGWTGMNYDLSETDEYDSRVFLTEAKAGMKFEDSQWGLYPSMGLTWTNWRTESHTSKVAANPDWNTRYDSLSEDWFQLFAGVDTSRTWRLEDNRKFSLTGGAGIKQALNDNDVSVAQSLMGQSALVEESTASTSAVLNLACVYAREAFRVKLGVISQHNEDYDSYTGYLQAGFMW